MNRFLVSHVSLKIRMNLTILQNWDEKGWTDKQLAEVRRKRGACFVFPSLTNARSNRRWRSSPTRSARP